MLVLLFGGCATPPAFEPSVTYRDFPSLGKSTTVAIGASMIQKAKVMTYDGIELVERLTVRGNGITSAGRFELHPGEFAAASEGGKWTYFESTDIDSVEFYALGTRADVLKAKRNGVEERIPLGTDGIRRHLESGRLEAYHISGSLLNRVPLPEDVTVEDTKVTKLDSLGFQRELIYNGKSGDTIRVLYREFQNDLVRPAFTQELSYDLADSDTIGFQEVRIRVMEANNTSITFEVLQGFPSLR
jgi:hypothetical protein